MHLVLEPARLDRAVHPALLRCVGLPPPPADRAAVLEELGPELPDEVGPWASAFVLLSWGLSGNALQELIRVWIADRVGGAAARELMPTEGARDPGVAPVGGLHGVVESLHRLGGRGSNAWAVASARSATGGTLLANDPHLDAMQPGLWIEMHLSAPGYRARGVALPARRERPAGQPEPLDVAVRDDDPGRLGHHPAHAPEVVGERGPQRLDAARVAALKNPGMAPEEVARGVTLVCERALGLSGVAAGMLGDQPAVTPNPTA